MCYSRTCSPAAHQGVRSLGASDVELLANGWPLYFFDSVGRAQEQYGPTFGTLGIQRETMGSVYTVVQHQQGTSEWLEWRNNGIGASDAPAIMGENPWKSSEQLLREKLGIANKFEGNAAMARGVALEPEARKRYETISKVRVEPACLQSIEYPWQRASVDGLAINGSVVVEIKCGESVYKKTSSSRQVPGYYIGQLQHILTVTGLSYIDFFCYLPRMAEVHLRVERDDLYIARLIAAEQSFWQQVIKRRK